MTNRTGDFALERQAPFDRHTAATRQFLPPHQQIVPLAPPSTTLTSRQAFGE